MRLGKYFRLMVLSAICAVFVSGVPGQTKSGKKPPRREFGWSLEKFEKAGEGGPKQDKPEAQERPGRADADTIRVNTDLVISNVLVVNEKGNPVIGLGQSDFIVKEDGKQQEIELFAKGADVAVPRTIVLIFFNGHYNRYDRLNSLRATKALVDKLAPEDKMAIATTDLKLALDYTNDRKLLKKTLDKISLKPVGNPSASWVYGTLMAVLDEMFGEKDVRPIVILQTTGGDLAQLKETDLVGRPEGWRPWSEAERELSRSIEINLYGKEIVERSREETARLYPQRGYGFSDVLERIEKSRATIYSIIPSLRLVGHTREEQLRRSGIILEAEWIRVHHNLSGYVRYHEAYARKGIDVKAREADGIIIAQTALIQVAALSGGLANFIEQTKDADRVYNDIFTIIENRYTIGYSSSNATRDGKRRSIEIEVRGHPEYQIKGKKSYLPPER